MNKIIFFTNRIIELEAIIKKYQEDVASCDNAKKLKKLKNKLSGCLQLKELNEIILEYTKRRVILQ